MRLVRTTLPVLFALAMWITAGAARAQEECAIVVNGNATESLSRTLSQDVVKMTEALRNLGIRDEDMRILNAERGVVSVDRIEKAIEDLAKKGCRDLVLFLTAHGAKTTAGRLVIQNTETGKKEDLRGSHLQDWVEDHPQVTFKIVVTSCYSGNLISLLNRENVAIVLVSSGQTQDCHSHPDPTLGALFSVGLVESLQKIAAEDALRQALDAKARSHRVDPMVAYLDYAFLRGRDIHDDRGVSQGRKADPIRYFPQSRYKQWRIVLTMEYPSSRSRDCRVLLPMRRQNQNEEVTLEIAPVPATGEEPVPVTISSFGRRVVKFAVNPDIEFNKFAEAARVGNDQGLEAFVLPFEPPLSIHLVSIGGPRWERFREACNASECDRSDGTCEVRTSPQLPVEVERSKPTIFEPRVEVRCACSN